jgi:hypothetical protein
MNYKCSYNNSTFPYTPGKKNTKKTSQPCVDNHVDNFSTPKETSFSNYSNIFSNLINTVLSPIEKAIGREITFDDLLLIALIYLLYTEKDNDNNILLLCLIFLLF